MKPLVSIICIAYNQEKFIKQTLEGFLMQETDFDFEIIIHDDASTDNTADIIRSYEKENQNKKANFRALYEKENQYSKGTYEFINTMFESVAGDYVAYCEGDDYWTDPKKLQKQVDFMKSNPSHGLCFHRVHVIFDNSNDKEYDIPAKNEKSGFTTKALIKRNYIQTNSVLYKRQDYSHIPADVMPQDWYLHLYHAQFGKIGFIDETMAVYRIHEGGVWHNSYEKLDEIWRKFGVNWLGLHTEMLNMYGDKPEYMEIIKGSIITSFNTLARLDSEDGSSLTNQALARYPEEALFYVKDLREQADKLQAHSEEQAKIIKHYVDLSESLKAENDILHAKKLIKLEGAVKKKIKRKRK